MTKEHFTNKEIKRYIKAGYIVIKTADYPQIIKALDPVGYTYGRDGWNSDVVQFNGIIINSGYRPKVGREATKAEIALLQEYNRKSFNYKNRTRLVNNFIRKFTALQGDR